MAICFLLIPCLSQAAAQFLSATMIIRAHSISLSSSSSLLLRPWFVVLVLAGAVERLSGVALGVAMERDWVVLVVPSEPLYSFIKMIYKDMFVCVI